MNDDHQFERVVGIAVLIILAFIILCVLTESCRTTELVEVETQSATIIKMDTVTRWPNNQVQIIWMADDGVKYAQFDQLPTQHFLGEHIKALFRK